MLIHLSATNPKPMYEQVVEEIQRLIVSGEMAVGEMLPSIRELSKELKTSGITIRRAYQELERSGFIFTRAGKGSFVASLEQDLLREWKMEQVQSPLWDSIAQAKKLGMTANDLHQMIDQLWEKVDQGKGTTDNQGGPNDES
ncbi:GntR family transcriptional regulator [Camelliibacillus cellulosilyticus]|uniref:GntR family transcriptional regulator n=1 Tax=Camelliibacillus cellulosilyticus TaxID=2174486 RepID=A0ABV9GPC6_9BACL